MNLKEKYSFGHLFGVNVNFISLQNFFLIIFDAIDNNKKILIGYINIRGANLAYENERFLDFYRKCNWITIDGIGIILALRYLGFIVSKKNRFTCPDYLVELLMKLSLENKSIFFLGGTDEVAKKMKEKINNEFPKLKVDVHNGYFDKEGSSNQEVLDKINIFKPDILYLGFGMPLQEYWILDNFDKIQTNVILPLGACMDFHTNSVFRGPKFLTENGLEWLVRLFTEPKRLWKRYIIGNPLFLYRLLKSKFLIRKKEL